MPCFSACLPVWRQVIIWVELTPEQRAYYKAIYENEIGTVSSRQLQRAQECMCKCMSMCEGPARALSTVPARLPSTLLFLRPAPLMTSFPRCA